MLIWTKKVPKISFIRTALLHKTTCVGYSYVEKMLPATQPHSLMPVLQSTMACDGLLLKGKELKGRELKVCLSLRPVINGRHSKTKAGKLRE
jgi:hypothetical protein